MSCHTKFTGPDLSITAEAEQEQASITCVRCQSQNIIKFGVRNNQQRYHCQICNYKFIALDVAAITKPAPTPDTPTCKRCKTGLTIKFGIIRKTQRYYCKKCDYEFIIVNDQEQEVQKKKEPLLQKIRKKMGKLSYHVLDKGIDIAADWFLTWLTGGSTYTLGKSLIRKKHLLEIMLEKLTDFTTRLKHKKL